MTTQCEYIFENVTKAQEETKQAIKQEVKKRVAEKGYTMKYLEKNRREWDKIGLGVSIKTYYRLIQEYCKGSQPKRETYIKVCKNLDIAIEEGLYIITLKKTYKPWDEI